MKNHIKVYLSFFGYSGFEYMPCEVCGGKANQVHHIVYRSKFGKKMKHLQDIITNLIGLCFDCHTKAHNEQFTKEYLTEVHSNFMNNA